MKDGTVFKRYGDTFKRYAYIGMLPDHEGTNCYYVSFANWERREGGSVTNISFDRAEGLARAFVGGCRYRFDPQVGIVLE